MIVAITMVRDEADIIAYTLRHMLDQVDHVIVADNGSADKTAEIVSSFENVTLIHDGDEGYWQDVKMTRLAHLAGDMGAGWVVPFDADEAWTLPDLNALLDGDACVVSARPHVYVPTPLDDPDEANPLLRICHRMPDPEPWPKVCFRYSGFARLHMGNHDVDRPGRRIEAASVRHYQWRSLDQVQRKARQGTRAIDAGGLDTTYCAHWRVLAGLNDEQLAAWWAEYVNQVLEYHP